MIKKRFPWLEFLIGVSACSLLWLLGYPQYEERATIAKRYQVRVNMYTLAAAIENYAAYNNGKFPTQLADFAEFFAPPINPYTHKPIGKEEIKIFQYESKDEPRAKSIESKNGRLRGAPGTLAYGYFITPEDTLPSAYGIVGFGQDGAPLADRLPSGEIEVFILHESD
ncbi:MAG: hypothetical protein QMD71_07330 [bacterium]|nr:hypothetical protein [bacterium]